MTLQSVKTKHHCGCLYTLEQYWTEYSIKEKELHAKKNKIKHSHWDEIVKVGFWQKETEEEKSRWQIFLSSFATVCEAGGGQHWPFFNGPCCSKTAEASFVPSVYSSDGVWCCSICLAACAALFCRCFQLPSAACLVSLRFRRRRQMWGKL